MHQRAIVERNAAAQQRLIDSALVLADFYGFDVDAESILQAKGDPAVRQMIRLEKTADLLEKVAISAGAFVEVDPEEEVEPEEDEPEMLGDSEAYPTLSENAPEEPEAEEVKKPARSSKNKSTATV